MLTFLFNLNFSFYLLIINYIHITLVIVNLDTCKNNNVKVAKDTNSESSEFSV